MTIDHHQPIDYMLADPADDVDHGLHTVDSTYYGCCGAIGRHAPDCNDGPLPPADATEVHSWRGDQRLFWTTCYQGSGVQLRGRQWRDDGRIDRYIDVDRTLGGFTSAEARGIAADFLDAADQLDALTAEDGRS